MSKKLTDSSSNRSSNKIAQKSYQQTLRRMTKDEGQGVYSREFLDIAEELSKDKTLSEEKKTAVLLNILSSASIPLFSENYTEVLKSSTLSSFYLGVMASGNCLLGDRGTFERIAEMTTKALGEGLRKSPTTLDLRYARGTLQQFGIQAALLSKERRISPQIADYAITLGQIWDDAIDVQENIANRRIVYLDDSLAITWYSACIENDKTFRASGEVTLAVRQPSGLWSFDKYEDTRVPIVSLRKAKAICRAWKGQKMIGQITHTESERIAKFLGFKVIGSFAHLGATNIRGFGK
jgi:hypothetical protein